MAKYDLPTELNFVMSQTNKEKVSMRLENLLSMLHMCNMYVFSYNNGNSIVSSRENISPNEIDCYSQIYYVGHSMGTTTYMAMNSMDPTWADKVGYEYNGLYYLPLSSDNRRMSLLYSLLNDIL